MSVQTVSGLVPLLAEKPVAQEQVWLPAVLAQAAWASQPPLFERHSLMSWQTVSG
jgi:hypothetical protein